MLAAGCASAPINGDDTGDDGGADSTAPVDSTAPGNDAPAHPDTGDHDTGMDSAPTPEGGDDSSAGGEGGDDAGGDDGSQDALPIDSGPTDSTDSSVDTGVGMDSSTPVDSGNDAAQDVMTGPGPITRVQSASNLATGTATSLAVTFSKAHQAGDLIVIAVGWTDTTYIVNTVTDSAGNTYHLAVGPTTYGADLTQSIYYAADIAASATGAKTTVTFNGAASAVDLRAAEYSGLSTTSPLDVTAKASNKSTPANSGSVTTTTGRELLFGAGMTNDSYTSTPTTGFTMIAVTSNGDMFEDRIVSATGSYAATGTFQTSGSQEWVIQLATFR
jgi:hypothetical protein